MSGLRKFAVGLVISGGFCGGLAFANGEDRQPQLKKTNPDPETGVRRRSPEFVRAGGSGGINRAIAEGRMHDSDEVFVKHNPPPGNTPITRSSPNPPVATLAPHTASSARAMTNSPPAQHSTRVAGTTSSSNVPDAIRYAAQSEVPGGSISSSSQRTESGTTLYDVNMTGGDQPRKLLVREDGVVLLNSRVPQ